MKVRNWAGSDVFSQLFGILAKERPLYKLRHVQLINFFLFKLTGTANAS